MSSDHIARKFNTIHKLLLMDTFNERVLARMCYRDGKSTEPGIEIDFFFFNSHDCFSTACYSKHHSVLPSLTLDFLIVRCQVVEKV